MLQRKVLVVHENLSMNFSDAERFGQVVFVTNREWNPRRGSMTNPESVDLMRRRFSEMGYSPDRDYIILNGPPVIMGYAFHMAMLAAGNQNLAGVLILSWDKRAGKYIEGLAETYTGK